MHILPSSFPFSKDCETCRQEAALDKIPTNPPLPCSSTHVCALGSKIFQPGWWTVRNTGVFPTSPFNTLFPQYYYWNERVWRKWNGKWGEGRIISSPWQLKAVQNFSLSLHQRCYTAIATELPGTLERSLLWGDIVRQPWEKAPSVKQVEKLGIPRGKIWLCN